MDGCWIRPPFPIALATDVVEVPLDLREAFEFPIGQYFKANHRWVFVQASAGGLDGRRALTHAGLVRRYMDHCLQCRWPRNGMPHGGAEFGGAPWRLCLAGPE